MKVQHRGMLRQKSEKSEGGENVQQGHAAAGSSDWQREDEGERAKQRGNVRRREEGQNIGQNQP